MEEGRPRFLLCRVRDVLVALPLGQVEETMRPLAVERIVGVPSFVLGLAVSRGVPIPVVDACSLLGGEASPPKRFVTMKAGTRRIALAVDAVVGVVEIPPASVDGLPSLFQGAGLEAIAAIGALDSELLLVLCSARLVPEEAWATIEAGGAPP